MKFSTVQEYEAFHKQPMVKDEKFMAWIKDFELNSGHEITLVEALIARSAWNVSRKLHMKPLTDTIKEFKRVEGKI